jgi:hypothetical protein
VSKATRMHRCMGEEVTIHMDVRGTRRCDTEKGIKSAGEDGKGTQNQLEATTLQPQNPRSVKQIAWHPLHATTTGTDNHNGGGVNLGFAHLPGLLFEMRWE